MTTDEILWQAVESKIEALIKSAFNVAAVETSGGTTWGRYDEMAVVFARWHTFALKDGIEQTTKEKLRQIFSDWIKERAPFKELVRRVDDVGVFSKSRARLIAMTESTRIHNTVVFVQFKDIGAEGARWDTAVDERVCPICGAIHGKIVKLGSSFPGTAVEYPPAHPGCRCVIRPVMRIEDRKPEAVAPDQVPGSGAPKEIRPGSLQASEQDALDFIDYGKRHWGNRFDNTIRSNLKSDICNELAKRTGLPPSYISDIIHNWAVTSNDLDMGALFIQSRAEAVLGARMSTWQRNQFGLVFGDFEKRYHNLRSELLKRGTAYTAEQVLDELKSVFSNTMWAHVKMYRISLTDAQKRRLIASDKDMDDLLASALDYARGNVDLVLTEMQKHTLDTLRKIYGKDTITVYRGMRITTTLQVGDIFDYEPNALESWSVDRGIAEAFGDVVMVAEVSLDRFAGSCYSGFGCYNELEVVLVGASGTKDKVRVYKVR
jgi:SPP1 gp7 family putative phage head morphogenesis protein